MISASLRKANAIAPSVPTVTLSTTPGHRASKARAFIPLGERERLLLYIPYEPLEYFRLSELSLWRAAPVSPFPVRLPVPWLDGGGRDSHLYVLFIGDMAVLEIAKETTVVIKE